MSPKSQPPPFPLPDKPLLLILSGLSGAGKDAVLSQMKKSGLPLEFIVTVTTRPRRPAEKDNVDYHFVAPQEFQRMMAHGELLEWAAVYGNHYGVPRDAVKKALASGRDTVVKVDVQGAATIKSILPEAILIFLTPPSMEEDAQRLKQRHTESPAQLELRLKTAQGELKKLSLFDYIVFNREGEIGRAAADIAAIITAEKCRVKPREVYL